MKSKSNLARGLGVVLVDVGDVLGEPEVVLSVGPISDEPEKIKAGKESRRKLNVLRHRLLVVVPSVSRVGSGKDGDSGVEGGHDASLGNGHGLLLHHFVNGGSILRENNNYGS